VLFHTCEASWFSENMVQGTRPCGVLRLCMARISCGLYSAQNEALCGPAVRRPLLPHASLATASRDVQSCAVCARHSALP